MEESPSFLGHRDPSDKRSHEEKYHADRVAYLELLGKLEEIEFHRSKRLRESVSLKERLRGELAKAKRRCEAGEMSDEEFARTTESIRQGIEIVQKSDDALKERDGELLELKKNVNIERLRLEAVAALLKSS